LPVRLISSQVPSTTQPPVLGWRTEPVFLVGFVPGGKDVCAGGSKDNKRSSYAGILDIG